MLMYKNQENRVEKLFKNTILKINFKSSNISLIYIDN